MKWDERFHQFEVENIHGGYVSIPDRNIMCLSPMTVKRGLLLDYPLSIDLCLNKAVFDDAHRLVTN